MKKSLIHFLLSISFITILLISCGESPVEPNVYSSGDIGNRGTNTGITNVPDNPDTPNKPDEVTNQNYVWDYYRVYVPFAAKNSDGYNMYIVSYRDGETLKRLWLEQLQRKGETDGKHFYIRNGNNTQSIENFKSGGEYYFFDGNGDMYYKKLNLKIKELVGAVIVKLRSGSLDGVYTVGGLYRISIARDEYMAIANTNNDNQSFRKVISPDYLYHYEQLTWLDSAYDKQGDMERQKGDLDIMVLNNGYKYNNDKEFGFDSYLYYGGNNRDYWNIHYFTNENVYLGARPEYITQILKFGGFTINYSDRTKDRNGQYPNRTSFKDYNFAFLPGEKEVINTTAKKARINQRITRRL